MDNNDQNEHVYEQFWGDEDANEIFVVQILTTGLQISSILVPPWRR
jgi:hypothetical protein